MKAELFPVFDGHNDLAWACRDERAYETATIGTGDSAFHTDIPRLRSGGVAGQFWSVWVDPALQGAEQVQATLEQIDFVHRLITDFPETFQRARTAAEARAAVAEGRIASLIGIEGGDQIGGSLAVLRQFARLGARYMTLTWSKTTHWADSATDAARHNGLTDFGREVVAEMNRIGVLIDLAHVSPATMRDALEATKKPLIVSHSGAWELCKHDRNVPDDVLKQIGEQRGVVMVAFVPSFITEARRAWVEAGEVGMPPEVTVADVADHIDHVRDVAGAQAVGIGADYDGTDLMPTGLNDVSGYPALFAELKSRGWTDEELRGLACDNVLRVLEASDQNYLDFIASDS